MDVLFDATPFMFRGTGIGNATTDLFDAMRAGDRDHDVDWTMYSRCFMEGEGFGKSKELEVEGVARSLHLRVPRFTEPWIQKAGWIEKQAAADVYHATDRFLPVSEVDDRLVLTVHDLYFMAEYGTPGGDAERYLRFVPDQLPKAARVIAVSEATKRDLCSTFSVDPERVRVIPWGVDHTRFCPTDDPEPGLRRIAMRWELPSDFLLAVGCSSVRKNTARLLLAHRIYRARGGELPLVLAWDAPAEVRDEYHADVERGHVTFLDGVDDVVLVDLMREARGVLHPSLREGFGMVVLEAMACGTPVVTSRVDALPEIGGDAPIYVDPLQTDGLCAAIANLEDDSLVAEMSRAGLRRALDFSWERCARQTLDVYREVFAEVGPSDKPARPPAAKSIPVA